MRLADWREVDPAAVAGLWDEQNARWSDRLAWDSSATWAQVEAQRRSGNLPGLILFDGRRICGWTFFLVHHGTLQIGALESDSPESTEAILDAVLSMAEPSIAPGGVMVFAFSEAPGILPALADRGFVSESYWYLVRDLANAHRSGGVFPWSPAAAAQVPSLLARAYGRPVTTRPFARQGTAAEWQEYAAELLAFGACGRFVPELSASWMSSDDTLAGAIVTTVIAPKTAHLAQVAIDPAQQGRGLGAAMLRDVIAKVKWAGFERVSLLVSGNNRAAVGLYSGSGFAGSERFISAGRDEVLAGIDAAIYPRRSTRPACETGGASTLR